jgi:hypothetical protein
MPKKPNKVKPVLDNHKPNAPLQFKVKEVEKNGKLKDKEVFDGLKKKVKKPNKLKEKRMNRPKDID